MPTQSNVASRRESWPPTQVRLVRSGSNKSCEPRPLLEDIDEDPLTYFLTPSSADDSMDFDDEDDEDEDDVMEFDAGIEVAGHPRQIIRSVSPSTLDGLRKFRAASPEFDSDGLTSEDDDGDDGEDYIRFSPSPSPPPPPIRSGSSNNHRYSLLLSAMPRHSTFSGAFGFRPRSPALPGRSRDGFLSPASSFPAPSTTASAAARGRSTFASRRGRSSGNSSASAQRVSRPGHLWRQPSVDVWSIEEETEEELMMMSEIQGSIAVRSTHGRGATGAMSTAPLSSKPAKKVRFLIPGEE